MNTRHHTVLIVLVMAALSSAACTETVSGQPQSGGAVLTESAKLGTTTATRPLIPTAPTSPGNARTYTTIEPTGNELPPHPDSRYACDLLSWDALDPRVRPKPLTPQYVWPITPSRRGSMECRIVNEDVKTKVVIASVVVWKQLAMLPQKTDDIAGHPATISERKPYQCTIVVDVDLGQSRGRTKVAFAVSNDRFIESGLEACTLTRQAASWALSR